MRLDDTDLAILRILGDDARISNKELAERVGVAQSTCLARVRALREGGVIRGYHADIEPRALGHDLQAMIAIRLQPHARNAMSEFVATLGRRPEVLEIYFVAGANDFLVHVATSSTDELRRFPPSPAPRPT
jgi:DNA-binding Lrp family transcriptional regulator